MQHQLADREAVDNRTPEYPRLFGAPAVTNGIIRIPFERDMRKGSHHPHVERMVQEQVRQERAAYSPYAKGNFTFDRVICGWRRGATVLDLRLKR